MVPETYEIFSGSPEKDPLWLECVTGFPEASQRMNERARKAPGCYFVYCVHTKQVLATMNTSPADHLSSLPSSPQRLARRA